VVDGAALEKRSPIISERGFESHPLRFTRRRFKDKMDKEWCFYIVRCKDNSLYSGIAINVDERIKEHNRGTGAKYTHARRPVTLVYSERHSNVSEAMKRESQVKSWTKTKKEQLIQERSGLRSE
jgi:putative endonuclease